MSFEVDFSEMAIKDLEEIFDFIIDTTESLNLARNSIDKIRASILNLDNFPERFPKPNIVNHKHKNLRKMSLGAYIVYYEVNKKNEIVNVVRIFSSKRDIENILEKN